MSGPEHRPPDDRELEVFLAGQGPHRARYRAASGECPPAELDALVLAQARAALAPRRGGLPRWRLPLSLAATLVLGVGLVSRVQREPLPTAAAPVVGAAAQVDSPSTVLSAVPTAQGTLPPSADAVPALGARAGLENEPARQAAVADAQKTEAAEPVQAPAVSAAAPAPVAGAGMAEVPPAAPPPAVAAPAAAALAPESQGEVVADAAPAAEVAPKAALQALPSGAAKSQRRAAVAALTPVPEVAPRYRGDRGLVLELPPGRYRLLAADEVLVAAGKRLVGEGGSEQLLGLGGEGGCRLWLEPLIAEPGQLLLTGDCQSGAKGEYRRLEPEP